MPYCSVDSEVPAHEVMFLDLEDERWAANPSYTVTSDTYCMFSGELVKTEEQSTRVRDQQ